MIGDYRVYDADAHVILGAGVHLCEELTIDREFFLGKCLLRADILKRSLTSSIRLFYPRGLLAEEARSVE